MTKVSRSNEDSRKHLFCPVKEELEKYIKGNKWSSIQGLIVKFPFLVNYQDPFTGALLLHKIARKKTFTTMAIDVLICLNPDALTLPDKFGFLPLHHAAANGDLKTLKKIHAAFRLAAMKRDNMGRLPLHIAAGSSSQKNIEFLIRKNPSSIHSMIQRDQDNVKNNGSLPIHIACRKYKSLGVVTTLLINNFASAQVPDNNGDLPIHLILKNGLMVDSKVVRLLLKCAPDSSKQVDRNGNLPLVIALKYFCSSDVLSTLLRHDPDAARISSNDGTSPLFLSIWNCPNDQIVTEILEIAPDMVFAADKISGYLPIRAAIDRERSQLLIYRLLIKDMPIDLNDKKCLETQKHHYSWNIVMADSGDLYFPVVRRILRKCTFSQVIKLAHIEDINGEYVKHKATALCQYELRCTMRLFHSIEMIDANPSYSNKISETEIFHAIKYEHKKSPISYVQSYVDSSFGNGRSLSSNLSNSNLHRQLLKKRMFDIQNEEKLKIIVKFTTRKDVMEREINVRENLSMNFVPALLSIHRTSVHTSYVDNYIQTGYCISIEGAEDTLENMLTDWQTNTPYNLNVVKQIAKALHHLHQHGFIHGDLGSHNVGKFGNCWKILGIGGSFNFGAETDPTRGIFIPPECVHVQRKRKGLGRKSEKESNVISTIALPSYDIWSFGVVMYEIMTGVPFPLYRASEHDHVDISRLSKWDIKSLNKTISCLKLETSVKEILIGSLHPDPSYRFGSMNEILDYQLFNTPKPDHNLASAKTKMKYNCSYEEKEEEEKGDLSTTYSTVNDLNDFFPPQKTEGVHQNTITKSVQEPLSRLLRLNDGGKLQNVAFQEFHHIVTQSRVQLSELPINPFTGCESPENLLSLISADNCVREQAIPPNRVLENGTEETHETQKEKDCLVVDLFIESELELVPNNSIETKKHMITAVNKVEPDSVPETVVSTSNDQSCLGMRKQENSYVSTQNVQTENDVFFEEVNESSLCQITKRLKITSSFSRSLCLSENNDNLSHHSLSSF